MEQDCSFPSWAFLRITSQNCTEISKHVQILALYNGHIGSFVFLLTNLFTIISITDFSTCKYPGNASTLTFLVNTLNFKR